MARVASPTVSQFYQRRHEQAGVLVHLDTAVTAFDGGQRVRSVCTASGEDLACDLVIVGIGVQPETGLAESAGLLCDNGIVVDEYTQTAAGNIFAAGDCTNHPNSILGRRLRLESVQNAADQGKVAALNMLGQAQAYQQLPWFWSDQYDLKLQIAGVARGDEQQIVRGDVRNGSFAVFYLAEDKVVAVEAVNRPRAFMGGKKLIGAAASVDPTRLADAAHPLAEVVKLTLAGND